MTEAKDKTKNYQHILNTIKNHPTLLNSSRHLKIRVDEWLSKLSTNTSNHLWRRNRNNYLQLLQVMLEVGQIIEPFTTMPKSQIPKLHSHQISCILLTLDRRTINQKKSARMKITSAQELWTQLQNQEEQTKIIGKKEENGNLGQVGVSILSPILNQQNSRNFSDLTYESLQGQLDYRENQQNIREKPTKYSQPNHGKYFNKKQQSQHTKPDTITLLQKIEVFLRKNEGRFREDPEFQKIYIQLQQMNKECHHPQYKQQRDEAMTNFQIIQIKNNINKLSGVNYFSKNRGQNQHQQTDIEKIDRIFDKDEEQESCDYFEGEYSQYSDIPFSQGISPQKISDIDKFNKYGHNGLPEIYDL